MHYFILHRDIKTAMYEHHPIKPLPICTYPAPTPAPLPPTINSLSPIRALPKTAPPSFRLFALIGRGSTLALDKQADNPTKKVKLKAPSDQRPASSAAW